MGLDACVYCNCYELGNLREPLPVDPRYVKINPGGYLEWNPPEWEQMKNVSIFASPEKQAIMDDFNDFDNWVVDRACEHKGMILLNHRLGNFWLVVGLRNELKREAPKFPILLEKVLYSFSHFGDRLTLEDVEQLKPELEALADFQCEDPQMIPFMSHFRQQMVELVEASLSVGKPIWF